MSACWGTNQFYRSVCSNQFITRTDCISSDKMPTVKTTLAELGRTESHNGEARAHVHCRDDSGGQVNIRGPCRATEEQAQKDLEQIRKASEKASTREEGLQFMRDEAQKLKDSAKYEAEIRETLRRRDTMDESDYEYEDVSDDSDPPWMMEHTEELPKSQSTRPILNSMDATAELLRFRPIQSTPSDLKYILENRANPNVSLKSGEISPLRRVMSFAHEKHVAEMRDLLLEFGAIETDEDKDRWKLRQRSDFCEKLQKSIYDSIDKDYDPMTASVEY